MTVGNTQIEVAELVERILARAGISPFQQTPDAVYRARINLFYFITSLSNNTLQLWKLSTKTLQGSKGRTFYTLPNGIVNLLSMSRRDITNYATGTDASSSTVITKTLTTAQRIVLAGVSITGASNASENTLTIETNEGSWTTRATHTAVQATGVLWFDIDGSTDATTQVRATLSGAGNAALVSLTTAAKVNDVPMGPFNKTDWANTPDKNYLGSPVNYYYDKRSSPGFYAWPVPNADCLFWFQYQHQGTDVPEMYETIEIPARWYGPLIDCVAYMVAQELPDMPPAKLQQLETAANKAEISGTDGETDGAPIRIMPKIRSYTR